MKAGGGHFIEECHKTRGNNFKIKKKDLDNILGRILYSESAESLEQIAQRCCGCLIPGVPKVRLDRASAA